MRGGASPQATLLAHRQRKYRNLLGILAMAALALDGTARYTRIG
jgi:hypothetical protein